MTLIGGLNQCSAIENLTLTQYLLEKKNKFKCIYYLYTGHQKYEQNNKKVNKMHISKMKGEKKDNRKPDLSRFLYPSTNI